MRVTTKKKKLTTPTLILKFSKSCFVRSWWPQFSMGWFRRILKSCVPTILLLADFAALASYALAAPAQSTSSYVRSSSYFNSDCKDSLELEWLADPGTNRFVTNNIKDFIPGTIVYSPLNVAVGGGTTTSPCAAWVNLGIQPRPQYHHSM